MGVPVPLGAWEPDKGPFNVTTTDVVSNLNPLANGWGPFPDLEAVGASIGAQCLGCWPARKSDGSFSLYAGTAAGLFLFDTATQTWSDVSKVGGYNVQGGHIWQALQFGTKFIVVNLEDPPQFVDVDAGGLFADLAGSPPQAKFIWAAGDFVVLGYLKVGADEYPNRIHWSGLNDATFWTVDRVKGSDRQDLPDGNEVTGGFGFPGGARVFQRDAKRAMVYTGGQFIFEIRVLDATRGCPFPYSIVPISANDYVFWRSDGIYRSDANVPIGAQRVDSFLLNALNPNADVTALDTCQGVADPFQKTVMWTYLGADGNRKVLAWDWELDRFFTLTVAPLLLFSALVPGYTLEQMDSIHSSIDAFTAAETFDSRRWKGGAPTIGAWTSDNMLSYFTGEAVSGTVETSTIEHNPDERSFVSGAKIKGNAGPGTTLTVLTAQLPDDALTAASAVTRSGRTGLYPMRSDAYYHRYRVTTAAADSSFTHMHALTIDAQPSGEV